MRATHHCRAMLWVCLVLVSLTQLVVRGFPSRVVDLTHTLGSDTLFWPGMPSFNFSILHRGFQDNGAWLEANWISMSEHGGTHVDAPSHFSYGGLRLDAIPLDRMMGPGAVFDFRRQAAADPDYEVTLEDIQEWEERYGTIPDRAILLFNFGWAKRWPHPDQVFNTDNMSDQTSYHFPGVHPDTISWLVNHRRINAVGMDTPSVDFGQSPDFRSHQTIASHGLLIVENVANLDLLPPTGTMVYMATIKLHQGSGGPVRIFATQGSTGFATNAARRAYSQDCRWESYLPLTALLLVALKQVV